MRALPLHPRRRSAVRPARRREAGGLARLAVLALLLELLGGSAARAQYIAEGGLEHPHPPRLVGRWVGVLPTRCGTARVATDVTLTLWSGIGPWPAGTYRMEQACRVPGLVPRVLTGGWVQLRGSSVLQLTLDGRQDTMSFLRLADGALRPLDRQLDPRRREVLSPLP